MILSTVYDLSEVAEVSAFVRSDLLVEKSHSWTRADTTQNGSLGPLLTGAGGSATSTTLSRSLSPVSRLSPERCVFSHHNVASKRLKGTKDPRTARALR